MQKCYQYDIIFLVVPELNFINYVEHFSYLAIFAFSLFAGYIIPFPEEVLLLIVGYMASVGFIHLTPAIFVVVVAIVIGDNILYRLTLKNNKHVTKLVHEVLSLKILIKKKDFIEKHLGTAIFISRFIPFLRFIGPVFAGYIKAKEKTFLLFNTLAIIIYVPIVIFIGYRFSDYFDWIVVELSKLRHFTMFLIWIIVGLIITRIVDYIFRKVHPEQ
jgi:membrane protein DedA with SNARE-associated domain